MVQHFDKGNMSKLFIIEHVIKRFIVINTLIVILRNKKIGQLRRKK